MRILHVTYIFPPKPNVADGITHSVYQLTSTLAKNGNDVTVYASNALDLHGKERIEINNSPACVDGVKVRYFPYLLRYGTFFFTPSMFRLIRDEIKKFDVIHIHDARCFQCAITMHYAELFNIPIIFQPRGSFKSSSPHGTLRKLLRLFIDKLYAENILQKCSKMIALTPVEAEQYRRVGVPKEKITIIPNGIDLSEYTNLPLKGSFKKKLHIDKDKKVILYIGRIHMIKGIDVLVRAYAYAVNNLELRNALLVLVGPDDGYLGELKQLLSSLKVNDILLIGPLYGKDKLEAYIDADAFILPSRYETFPNVVLEAYACSKPAVASNIMSIPDIVINERTGLLFRSGDVEDLAKKIIYMLSHVEESKEMGIEARKFVEEKLSINKVTASLESLYEEILKGEDR